MFAWVGQLIDSNNAAIAQGWAGVAQATFAAVLIFVGVIQIAIYVRMRKIMDDPAKIMRGQLKEVKSASRVAEQTISNLERPHVFLIINHNFAEATRRILGRMYESIWPHTATLFPAVAYSLKTYGKTPAIITQIMAQVVVSDAPPSENVAFSPRPLPSESVIAPSETSIRLEAGMSDKYVLTEDDFRRLQNGDAFWWFYGVVRYDDILGWGHIHHFCWRWDFAEAEPRLYEMPVGISQSTKSTPAAITKLSGLRQAAWEPASYNIQGEDGQMYGRWRRVWRRDPHGLTVVSRYAVPPGKAWKVVGKAPPPGEYVIILDGHYHDTRGRATAGPGTYMLNAPGAIHGGISCGLKLFIHCCSGTPDEIVSIDLIEFEPGRGILRAGGG